MSSDRLRQVERNLTRLRQQWAGKEDTLTTIAPEERVRIKRQMPRPCLESLRPVAL